VQANDFDTDSDLLKKCSLIQPTVSTVGKGFQKDCNRFNGLSEQNFMNGFKLFLRSCLCPFQRQAVAEADLTEFFYVIFYFSAFVVIIISRNRH
jgi:hypothetical protein